MSRTFEELASQELDELYQGALFLRAGDRTGAEELLVDTLTEAARDFAQASAATAIRPWLEGRLARTYLAAPVEDAAGPAGPPPAWAPETARLLEAAAELPALPRVALWLVLLRRWSYADASEALGVDGARMAELLAYRDILFAAVMGGRGRGTGTDGAEVRS